METTYPDWSKKVDPYPDEKITSLKIEPIIYTQVQMDSLTKYRECLDILWVNMEHNRDNKLIGLRDELFQESQRAFRFIKEWHEAVRKTASKEFELLAEPEYL